MYFEQRCVDDAQSVAKYSVFVIEVCVVQDSGHCLDSGQGTHSAAKLLERDLAAYVAFREHEYFGAR